MGVVQIHPPGQALERLDGDGPLLFPLPRLSLLAVLSGHREGPVQVRCLELPGDLAQLLPVAGRVNLVRQHDTKALETGGVRPGRNQCRIDVLAR